VRPVTFAGQVDQRQHWKVAIHRINKGFRRLDDHRGSTLVLDYIDQARGKEEVGLQTNDGMEGCGFKHDIITFIVLTIQQVW
jgi:hypothetical protein